MIDLHAHILPGLDDGAGELEDSLGLAELALEGGVDILVATPHSNQTGRFENYNTEELRKAYKDFCEILEQEKLPLKVLPGMEIFASEDMQERIMDGSLTGLNDSDYYLVEFPFDADPYWIGDRLEEILETGKTPLIAHPERYFCAQDYPALVYEWLQMGCRTQMNKGSIFGKFGRHAAQLADIMLTYGLVTCVASDAHSPYARTTYMGDIQDYLADRMGEEITYQLLESNPRKIIYNRKIAVHGRRPERRRRFFR